VRRRLLGILVLLALAPVYGTVSGASFNARTANPSTSAAAGTLTQTNSKDGAAILAAPGLEPGTSATGTVDVTNTGDVDGRFTLSPRGLTDAPASPALSAKLDLTIADLGAPGASPAPAPANVYSGKVGAMGTLALGRFDAGESRRYRFTVAFPAGTLAADAAYQGASTQATYDWDAVTP